jgi:hypothetical protein
VHVIIYQGSMFRPVRQAAADQVGRYWIFFSLRLTKRIKPSRSAAAKSAMARLSSDQMPFGGIEVRRVSG